MFSLAADAEAPGARRAFRRLYWRESCTACPLRGSAAATVSPGGHARLGMPPARRLARVPHLRKTSAVKGAPHHLHMLLCTPRGNIACLSSPACVCHNVWLGGEEGGGTCGVHVR